MGIDEQLTNSGLCDVWFYKPFEYVRVCVCVSINIHTMYARLYVCMYVYDHCEAGFETFHERLFIVKETLVYTCVCVCVSVCMNIEYRTENSFVMLCRQQQQLTEST